MDLILLKRPVHMPYDAWSCLLWDFVHLLLGKYADSNYGFRMETDCAWSW